MNIGIDIGGSHIAVGVVDGFEIIIKKEHNWTEDEKLNLPENIVKYAKEIIKNIIQLNYNIKKIGIGFPAANIVNGVVYKYGEVIDLPKILLEEFGIPTYLKNDVKCSALCEKFWGSLRDYDNCIFMTLGTGIGGAYFYKDELVKPNKYQGFEIGHMIINKNGEKCNCGRKGCFEQYASMKRFRSKIEELFEIKNVTSYKVIEIVESKKKEEEVKKIIEEYTDDLAIGITNIINIFEPDAICIGGSFTYYATIFIDKLRKKVQQILGDRMIPEIVIAKYENDAGIIGASMLESN